MVIIEHPVIYFFTGSAVVVNRLRFFRPSWHRGIEADAPYFAKPISGIVVMCGIKAEVTDREVGVDSLKLPQGDDDGADAVAPSGVKKADMEGESILTSIFCEQSI